MRTARAAIRDHGTIAERPHILPVAHLKMIVHDDAPVIQTARQGAEERMR
jgi:hypothetical protein